MGGKKINDDIRAAILGDHEAAKRLTEAGLLLACPMCGKASVLHSIDNCKTVYAVCPACGLMTRACKGHEKARLAWNTRAAIKSLNSPYPETDFMEKGEAIHKIMSMETINSVTKQDLLRCVKWLWNRCFEYKENNAMKWIYICSPLRGNYEGNTAAAIRYCREVALQGYFPIAPHIYCPQFLDDTKPEIRELLNTYCGYDLGPEDVILLQIGGVWYFMADIGLRMLTPRELYRANGFPDDYKIERDYTGQTYGKSKQVARCGNAVPPPFAAALVRANLPEWCGAEIRTMEELEKVVAV